MHIFHNEMVFKSILSLNKELLIFEVFYDIITLIKVNNFTKDKYYRESYAL